MTDRINEDTARIEFERFADAMDLDLDTDGMDENERRDTGTDIRRVIKAIVKGSVVVDEEGILSFMPTKKQLDNPIVFGEPSGDALLAMDKKKQHAEVGKLYASLGALTKTPPVTFSRMHMSDLKICLSVYTLLMI